MPDPFPPDASAGALDDLVSAYVDGEANAAERAQVEADPALLERAAAFRALAQRVAAPGPSVDDEARDAAVAAALGAASPPATVTRIGRARFPAGSPRPWLVAATVVLLALGLGVLANTGLGGDDGGADLADSAADTDSSAGSAQESADSAGALAVGPAGAPVDLGPVDGLDQLRERLAAETGIGTEALTADAAQAFDGIGGDEAEGPVEGEAEGAAERDARLNQDCEVELVEANPQLLGLLVQATTVYEDVDALVYAYSAASGPDVVVIVVATDDCRNLDRFVIDG